MLIMKVRIIFLARNEAERLQIMNTDPSFLFGPQFQNIPSFMR